MRQKSENDAGRLPLPLTAAIGTLAGICNGLCGSGGGIVLYFALSLARYGDAKDRFAVNVAAVSAMSAVSAFFYLYGGKVTVPELLPLLPFALCGGLAGAFLTDRIRTQYLKVVFSVLILYGGIRML